MDREIFVNASSFVILVAILLIPAVLFSLSIQNTLKAVNPNNRKLPIYAGWLLLIPYFNLVWQFVVATKLSYSIELELNDNGIVKKKPTFYAGIVLGIVQVCAYFPYINDYTIYLWFVCFFIYWASIAKYRRKLNDLQSMLDGVKN